MTTDVTLEPGTRARFLGRCVEETTFRVEGPVRLPGPSSQQ
jgi:hypothetical protein